jgi:MinD-like ATPase involved in chromosome partitioning or flagellar assembly
MKNVIVALGLVEWESMFVSGLGHPMFGISVQRRCVDGIDIRAAIQVVECHGVIVSDATPRIDQDLIAELRELDIPLIAITSDCEFWSDQGVTKFAQLDDKNPLQALKIVSELLRGELPPVVEESKVTGIHIAVAGFGGASGRTTTVKELSLQLSQLNMRTVMIDADTYGPSLDQELGLDVSTNGLLELCRVLEKKSAKGKLFADLVTQLRTGLSVVPGLPRVSRWTDLRISALRELWQESKENFDVVVTDVGAILEVDQSLMHETSLPRRHAASLTALESADVTIICARADSVGVARLVRGYLELHELFAKSSVYVLLWGIMNEAQARDIKNAVTRHTGIESVSCIDLDWDLSRKALQQTTFMSALNPRSEVSVQYQGLAKLIATDSKLSQTLGSVTPLTKRTRKSIRRVA